MGSMEHIQLALSKAREEVQSFVPLSVARRAEVAPAAASAVPKRDCWSSLPSAEVQHAVAEQNRLVSIHRENPAYVAFDMLRTRTQQMMKQNNWKSVAITSPGPGCGKTAVALNLAFSFAHRHEGRVVLIDLDLRRPMIAKMLGMPNPPTLENFLSGRTPVTDTFIRYGNNIAIAANGRPLELSSETLQSGSTANAIANVKRLLEPDLIIFDLPPFLPTDDVQAFLPNVDSTILVVAADQSKTSDVDQCERHLAQSSNLLGVVLNRCRYTPDTGYTS